MNRLESDRAGLGCSQAGVEVLGLLPVVASRAGIVAGADRCGEAGVGAGLLVSVVDLDSQIEGGRVLAAGVGEPAADQGELAQPVAGIRLAGQVAQLGREPPARPGRRDGLSLRRSRDQIPG